MNLDRKLTSSRFGLIGGSLSILFFLCFLTLGFLQPDYNHIRDTISKLVDGKFGWIQTLNFGILIFSAVFIGFGLKKNIIKNKNILATITFWLCVIELIGVLIFPADKIITNYHFGFTSLSLTGKIHYLAAFILIITISMMAFLIIQDMKKNLYWKKLVPYSYFVLFFNLIFGIIWYYFNEQGFLFEWKGLFQKIIVINILVWLVIVGFRLWKLEIKNI
ncbi:MAG: DUF998 domain-containing protein [Candidatus Shapirobacteria bacterium]|nr:DUF998 domain-containing protein [Candidatus Shapirobacteria bacterium]